MDRIKNNRIVKWASNYVSQLLFLAFIIVVVSLLSDVFLTRTNLINVLRQISTNLYMGCALTMILITGGIDLSTGSVIAIAGMVCTYITEVAGLPFGLGLVAALCTGLLTGCISGTIIANTTLPPFIVTYSMQSILRGIVYVVTGASVIRIKNDAFLNFGGGFLGFIPLPVVYLVIIVAVTATILNKTKLGRHMYAVGGNAKCAQYAGINIKRTRIFMYMFSGMMAALAGIVLTSRTTSMQPTLGTGMEMDAIAAVVLGGTSMGAGLGAVGGTVIGALIIGLINNGLNLMSVDSFYQYILKGIIILAAVYMDYIKNQKLMSGAKK